MDLSDRIIRPHAQLSTTSAHPEEYEQVSRSSKPGAEHDLEAFDFIRSSASDIFLASPISSNQSFIEPVRPSSFDVFRRRETYVTYFEKLSYASDRRS